jgi:hypothetical protein
MESPLPSASTDTTSRKGKNTDKRERKLTGEARLTYLSPSPVQIIALETNPVSRLMLDRSTVTGI